MNPTLLLASIAAALAGSAQAGYIYMYSPYSATQCKPGNVCPIAWHVSHDGPQFDRIDIELLAGEAHCARVIAPIVLGYDLSQGNTYMWNVPQAVIPDGEYFIRIKGVGTDYQSYSHSFPIALEGHTVAPTIKPTGTATGTATETATGTVVPTRSGSILSSISSAIKTSTAATAGTSSSSAMSVQGSVSVAAAVVAAAVFVMMF